MNKNECTITCKHKNKIPFLVAIAGAITAHCYCLTMTDSDCRNFVIFFLAAVGVYSVVIAILYNAFCIKTNVDNLEAQKEDIISFKKSMCGGFYSALLSIVWITFVVLSTSPVTKENELFHFHEDKILVFKKSISEYNKKNDCGNSLEDKCRQMKAEHKKEYTKKVQRQNTYMASITLGLGLWFLFSIFFNTYIVFCSMIKRFC